MAQEQDGPIAQLRAQVARMLETMDLRVPIAATVVFKVNPAREDVFLRNSDALAEATRKLPGCNIYAYHEHKYGYDPRRPFDPRPPQSAAKHYMVYEDWQTTKQFRAQWDSPHLKQFQDTVLPLITDVPALNFYYGWSDRPGGAAVLPQTGQRLCWSSSGAPIDCKDTGQDGESQAGALSPSPRFAPNGDGTVTDRMTGLTWLQDADRFGEVTWDQALAKVRSLAAGSGGLNDGSKPGEWRLPTIRELFSLIDYGAGDPLIPEDHPFSNVKSAIYWTSTSLAAAPKLAWMMTLGIGPTVFDLKLNPNRMWPVRKRADSRVPKTGQKECWDGDGTPIGGAGTGQDGELQPGVAWPDPRFTDNDNGTVTDNLTGLVWLKNADPFGWRTWEQALNDCRDLSDGGIPGLADGSKRGDWRLPNIREIESLVDYGRFGPCLPVGEKGEPFENVRPSSYWTSTSVAKAPSEAMFIILGVGPSIFESKEHPFFVWPVRDRLPAR